MHVMREFREGRPLARRAAWAALVAMALLVATTPVVYAYPDRAIEFVVPFSAGGGSDILARSIVQVIEAKGLLPRGIIVDNRPGGSGAIGYNYLAQRRGDPHYIGTLSVSFFTTPLLGQSPVNYTHFTPVAALAYDPYVLVVPANSDIRSFADVLKRNRLVSGTTGIVSDAAILSKMLEEQTGVSITIIPYDSDGEILTALLGGHIDIQWGNPTEVLAQVQAGEMRALAVTDEQRLPSLPDVPTFRELGVDIVHRQLRGVVMPADVPEEAVAFMEGVLRQVAESPEWLHNYVEVFDVVPIFLPREQFAKLIEDTNNLYARMLRSLGVIK